MACLHLLRCGSFTHRHLTECTAILADDDAIILLDDGCYSLADPQLQQLCEQQKLCDCYVIVEHATARALTVPSKHPYKSISINTLAELLFQFDNSITWQ